MPEREEAVLVLAATTAYQTGDLVAAAERLNIRPVLATDRCRVLASMWPEGSIALDFRDPEGAARAIADRAARDGLNLRGAIPTDERTGVVAACAAEALGLPYNPPSAAAVCADKVAFRRALAAAGEPQPPFELVAAGADPAPAARAVGFPLVVKPTHLSASRGVMRADGPEELRARAGRLERLLADPDVAGRDPESAGRYLVEAYVPGEEVAYEGLLSGGELVDLAIFEKPDPLVGPFFPETIYVTPPRRSQDEILAIRGAVSRAARAAGLREGPVHAELRLGERGPVVLELAGRSIGGLCGRVLRYGTGLSVEEAVVAHAAGVDPRALARRGAPAAGVLMIPVPRAGVIRAIEGQGEAAAVPGVEEVSVTASPGDVVAPLPEGNTYLGFLFATGSDSESVASSLRRGHAALAPRIAARLSA